MTTHGAMRTLLGKGWNSELRTSNAEHRTSRAGDLSRKETSKFDERCSVFDVSSLFDL